MEELSLPEARAIAIRAQQLDNSALDKRSGTSARIAAVDEVLRQLGAVQLDTISVLARSHELIPYARLGAVGREVVERSESRMAWARRTR